MREAVGSTNKESQDSGCYNVTFAYTNQETVQALRESDALVPR